MNPHRHLGAEGVLRTIRDDATQLLIACYASPKGSTLFNVVPLMDRLMPSANDGEYDVRDDERP